MSEMSLIIAPFRKAFGDGAGLEPGAFDCFGRDTVVRLAHPLGDMDADGLKDTMTRLRAAIPDVERRDTILISGSTDQGEIWIGACGYYCGRFQAPWLGIPPTGQMVSTRFHEFFRIEDGTVVEMQAIWDIPEVMMQAGVWPMQPSLGREWHVPGPASQDGLGPHEGAGDTGLVRDMLVAMSRHPSQGGPEVMELERFWHPHMSWYGPAGIGTCRGIDGFRRGHQIPFLNAMPDRGQHPEGLKVHMFGQGNYVGLTGWPNMRQTITGDGWLGIAPTGQRITMRSLDFWRIEAGTIRENWVLIDLLDMYAQIGVDVIARMNEIARNRRIYGAA